MSYLKLFLTILVFYSILYSITYSQNAWIRQDSIGGSTIVYGIDFLDENTGYISGTQYCFYKTINGGQNWIKVLIIDSSSSYKIVNMMDYNNIIFTGQHNIFKSTNSGINWISIPFTSISINDLFMFNLNLGYITTTGSNALTMKTTDGGYNWTVVLSTTNSPINDICCLNNDSAISVGNTLVYKTVNGGNNWTSALIDNSSPGLTTCTFVNNSTGFAGGMYALIPVVYKTTNFGGNWIRKTFRSSGTFIYKFSFCDLNNGYAVGDGGFILKTTNCGVTWIKQSKLYRNFYSVCCRSVDKATIGGTSGVIYATTNGGWEMPLSTTLIAPRNDSSYITLTPKLVWNMVEYNAAVYRIQISLDSMFSSTVMNTGNIGDTSYIVPSNTLSSNNIYFWRVRSENPIYSSAWSSIWKFSTSTPSAPNLISPVNNDTTVIPMQFMDWSDSYTATTYNAQISKDSIFTQIIVDTTSINSQFNVQYGKLLINTNYYWRARANNEAGSGAWSLIWKFRTSSSYRPNLIAPLNNDSGIVYNTIFDWQDFINASYYRLQFALDSSFNNITYDNSYIYGSQYTLKTIMLQNTYYYWRVNATVSTNITFWSQIRRFKTSPLYSGILTNEEIPTELKLYNNYPNPFNPITKIRFDIPNAEYVFLTIFNSLGEEIIKLVNQNLTTGSYEVEFDGTNYSSGIYFYKFIAGKYSVTKKMILIK